MGCAPSGAARTSSRPSSSTDRGSTYTANDFTQLCAKGLGIRQSMGRVGSCFDNAAAESFSSTLVWDVLSRHEFRDPDHARIVILERCHEFYNTTRRHSSAKMMSPVNYENSELREQRRPRARGSIRRTSTIRGESQNGVHPR